MGSYETYVFILCLIVFLLLTGVSIFAISTIVKQLVKLIRLGGEDNALKIEYVEMLEGKRGTILEKIVSYIFCAIFLVFSVGVLYINVTQNSYSKDIPNLTVVKTKSMEEKNPKNEYLYLYNLDNQISAFDLIFVYEKPSQEDLKLYDIVVYEVDGVLLVHRIVQIEEPNQAHPNERWFLCQGDAVDAPDRFPVKYSQIRAIYRGERVPFVGSFVLFMQSPAGWLCIILIVGAIVATPIIEKKIQREKDARCYVLYIEYNNGDESIEAKRIIDFLYRSDNTQLERRKE